MTAKKKKMVKGLVVVALIAIIGIGATLAYFSFTTDQKTNKFTSDANLPGKITETEWQYGKDGWKDYQPGSVTAKNPQIVNESKNTSAYVAMKVVILDNTKTDGTVASFTDLSGDNNPYFDVLTNGTVGYNTSKWVRSTTYSNLYIYKGQLAAGATTEALFTNVQIKSGIQKVYTNSSATEKYYAYDVDANGNRIESSKTEIGQGTTLVEQNAKIYQEVNGVMTEVTDATTKLPSFDIQVTGYGVQTANLEMAADYQSGTAFDQLATLAGLK